VSVYFISESTRQISIKFGTWGRVLKLREYNSDSCQWNITPILQEAQIFNLSVV